MLQVWCTLVLIFFLIQSEICETKSLPPYVKACKKNDPNINKCVIEHGNEAIPKLSNGDKKFRLPSSKPFKVDEAVIEPGQNLKLALRNMDVIGLDQIKIIDADMNLKKHSLKMLLNIPRLQILGDYEINGRILILPIVGKGKGNITCDDMQITYKLYFEEVQRNGINQFSIVNNTVDYTTSRIYYTFENLFNGEPRLVAEMSKFLDENWREIDEELHDSFNQIIANIIKSLMVQITQDLPYDEIYLP